MQHLLIISMNMKFVMWIHNEYKNSKFHKEMHQALIIVITNSNIHTVANGKSKEL
jgi:hypothetical protein